ncbi:hypothetical protein HF325_000929 [Metschnikowia pulcherrima]|uniref:RRM domain-containing protein n=1 Tax=Metschnikowia pulcherrima TaxID=27326 RepID=A0A8H7LHW8_9ASCO|nr:hypothetical protein HF325_000929 [Metschnikowia pulcherrima]
MSSYEDDEALFEDLYDDESKSETKPSTKGADAGNAAPSEPKADSNGVKAEADHATSPPVASAVSAAAPGNPETAKPNTDAAAHAAPMAPVPSESAQGQPAESQNQQYGNPQSSAQAPGQYGEILDYTIMKDSNTGRSRGFGFLTFKDPRAVDEVIKKDHILDGKLIDPKRAIAREEQDKVGKIFVGGIDPLVNEKDFNDFFSQFGRIIDAQLMIDKDTGRSRGFGFITYDSPEAVDRRMQWFMFQQQQQQAGTGGQQSGEEPYGEQPAQQPLNPQQQAAGGETTQEQGDANTGLNVAPKLPGGPAAARPDGPRVGARRDRFDSDSDSSNRRLNLPKGPRRGPAAPANNGGGYRGGRGGYKKGGFHPYGRGGRR